LTWVPREGGGPERKIELVGGGNQEALIMKRGGGGRGALKKGIKKIGKIGGAAVNFLGKGKKKTYTILHQGM